MITRVRNFVWIGVLALAMFLYVVFSCVENKACGETVVDSAYVAFVVDTTGCVTTILDSLQISHNKISDFDDIIYTRQRIPLYLAASIASHCGCYYERMFEYANR